MRPGLRPARHAATTAVAAPSPEERYLKSYGSPPAVDASTTSALAQEQYYSSYGMWATTEARRAVSLGRMKLAWPIRSIGAGTAVMTLSYAAERRLRGTPSDPLDYDDSLVPGQVVAAVMHLPHVTPAGIGT